jgi:hypothetical protein
MQRPGIMAPPSLYDEPPRPGLMAAGPAGGQRPEISLSTFLWSIAALLATVELATQLALT